MRLLNDLLPSSAQEPFWTFWGSDFDPELGDQEYAWLEYYCENPACDCLATVVEAVLVDEDRRGVRHPLVEIEFKWGSEKAERQLHLTASSPRTQRAQRLLKAFTQCIQDPDYVNRLRTDYFRVKALATAKTLLPEGISVFPEKIGRNDACWCGSGKKYKKCCLNKPQDKARFVPPYSIEIES